MTSPFSGKIDVAALMQVNALRFRACVDEGAGFTWLTVWSLANEQARKDNPD